MTGTGRRSLVESSALDRMSSCRPTRSAPPESPLAVGGRGLPRVHPPAALRPLAQSDRAPAYEAGGCRFESCEAGGEMGELGPRGHQQEVGWLPTGVGSRVRLPGHLDPTWRCSSIGRAPPCRGGSCGFESRRLRERPETLTGSGAEG